MEKREKRQWRRSLLAVLLTLLMLVGMIPSSVYAAEPEAPQASGDDSGLGEGRSGDGQEKGQGSPDASIDVTASLAVEDGGTAAEAGGGVQLTIRYSVPKLSEERKDAFTGANIQFSLPPYLRVDTNEDGSCRIEGQEVTKVTCSEQGDRYTVELKNGESLTPNSTNTVTVGMKTENLVTPNNTSLVLDGFTFNVNEQNSAGAPTARTLSVPTTSAVVKAESDWQVEKTIVSEDADAHVPYIRDGESFAVTYQLTVRDRMGSDRLGRLGFEQYTLTDVFPTGLPQGGGALAVEEVKLLHGDTTISLAEGADYTLSRDGDNVTGIVFTTLDTVREGDTPGQYQQVGQVIDTTYQYTVRYPFAPYATESGEPEVTVHTLTNTATMDYTLCGGVKGSARDTAEFQIGAYEDGAASAAGQRNRERTPGMANEGNQPEVSAGSVPLDDSSHQTTVIETVANTSTMGKIQIGKYACNGDGTVNTDVPLSNVVFGVYVNEGCTTPLEKNGAAFTLATGTDGTVLSGWLEPGTYYLKETQAQDGYVLSDTVYKVTVEANQITTAGEVDGKEADLTAIGNGKKGGFTIRSYGAFVAETYDFGEPTEVLEQLSGATFTLYSYEENDGSLDETPELPKEPERPPVEIIDMEDYTQTVTGLEPGTYWLRETAAPDDTWDTAADTLVQILPDGTARCGILGEDGKVIWSEAGNTPSIDLKNYSNKPRIRVTVKVFQEEDALIDGARFELYQQVPDNTEDAQEIQVGGYGVTVWLKPVTDANGIVTVESGTARDENGNQLSGQAVTPKLEPGKTYWLKETELQNDNYFFDPEYCWSDVRLLEEAKGQEVGRLIVNYRKNQVPVYTYKASDQTTPLAGALAVVFRDETKAEAMVSRMQTEYKEWDADSRLEAADICDTVGQLTDQAKDWGILQAAVSDGSGRCSFANLVPRGTYYIMELVAPDGYQLEKDGKGGCVYHQVTISSLYDMNMPFYEVDGDPFQTNLNICNYELRQIVLDKVSLFSGQEYRVSGAAFTIYGSREERGEQVPDPDEIIGALAESGSSGQYRLGGLPEGTYWIAETQFPEGFSEEPRGALSDADQATFGAEYDYVSVGTGDDAVRYYKAVLGRDADNTWFTQEGGHAVYSKANVGLFALTKVSSLDAAVRVEATFSLEKYDENTKDFESYTDYPSITADKGTAYTLSDFLEPGTYRLREISTEESYTLSADLIYIQIEAGKITDGSNKGNITIDGETVQGYLPADNAAADNGQLTTPISVENVPQGKFWIEKTGVWNGGEDNGGTTEPLIGVTFEVYQKNSDDFAGDTSGKDPLDTITTDGNGIAESGLLDAGEYWVIETSVAESDKEAYGKDSYTAFTVTVTAGTTTRTPEATTKVENTHNQGKFAVTKEDGYDQKPLTGAILEIYDNKDCTGNRVGVMSRTDPRTGAYTSPFLAPGSYWLKETEAPSDYYLPEEGIVFGGEKGYQVMENGLTEIQEPLTNDLANSLTVGIYQQIGQEETDELITTSPAAFGLYATEAEAEAATAESPGSPVRSGDTGSTGTITWTNLSNGTYYLKKLSEPEGYISDLDTVYPVVLDNETQERKTDYEQKVYNIFNYGRFRLFKKTKAEAGDAEGIGLSGAKYTLERYNEEAGAWEYVGQSPEESAFTVTSENIGGQEAMGVYTSEYLSPGKYRVTEVEAPASIQNSAGITVDFTVDSTPIVFTITPGATVEKEQWDGIKRTLQATGIADEKNGGVTLSGVTFQLWTYREASEEGLETEYDRVAAHKGELVGAPQTTGENGAATWSGLEPGRYVLLETEAPEGYVLTAQVVDIPESSSYLDVVHTLDVVNESKLGRMVIQKTDADGKVICNEDGKSAIFAIYNIEDTAHETPLDTVEVSGDGTGRSRLLPVGDYWAVEIQAPEGYSLDSRLEQNISAKRVTVSGSQNPAADFEGVSPTASEGYTDLVIFQNRSIDSVKKFSSDLEGTLRLEGSQSGYTESAHSEESLMYGQVDVWFLLSGLTDGANELPAERFVVTDDTLCFQGLTQGSADSYYTYMEGEELTAADYAMRQIRLYKSVNESGAPVLATLEAKVDGQWQTVQENLDLTAEVSDGSYVTAELPEDATGVRVSYTHVEAGFKAGNIEVKVTLKQRPSNAGMPEIRQVINQAALEWEDTALDNTGNPAHHTGTASDTASVTFGSYMEDLPALSLTNRIISGSSAAGYYYSGDTVEIETAGTVPEGAKGKLRHPVMAVTLPPYTTLDEELYSGAQGGGKGIRAILSEPEGQGGDGETLDFTLFDPIQTAVELQVDTDGDGVTETVERTCWQYVLDFGEDLALEPGQSITLQYGARIDSDIPDTAVGLESWGYIGSGYQLPLTAENPTGMSYEQAPGDDSSLENSQEIAEAVGSVSGESLTCLKRPVSFKITRGDAPQVYKSIAAEEGQWLSPGATAEVEPGGTLYYRLSLVNAGDPVKEIRFVDIIPFTGDTVELRALWGEDGLNRRSTSLPVSDGEHTYEQVELLWVNGNPDGAEGVQTTVYYCVGGSWDEAARLSRTGAEELPMLASKSEDVWEGWTTVPPEDLSQVTAVGMEVTFADGSCMEAGDIYNVTLAMRAPNCTAEEMEAYEDALIGNTTGAAVVRVNDAPEEAMRGTDRASSNEALAKLKPPVGSIGDCAFYDNNGNGVQDEGDKPAGNVEVNLYRRMAAGDGPEGEWELHAAAYTDAQGKYLFENLTCAGYEYRVEFAIPQGCGAAPRYAGEDRALDSDIDEKGWTEAITLGVTEDGAGNLAGESNLTVDAGFVALAALGDYVWIDTNGNGIQEENEPGLNGVTVNLYRLKTAEDSLEGLKPYATQLTADQEETGRKGYYCFTGLPKGLYVVEFDLTGTKTGGYTSSYAFTEANAGSPDADSDAKHSRNGSNTVMYTDVIELREDDMTWDAGVYYLEDEKPPTPGGDPTPTPAPGGDPTPTPGGDPTPAPGGDTVTDGVTDWVSGVVEGVQTGDPTAIAGLLGAMGASAAGIGLLCRKKRKMKK